MGANATQLLRDHFFLSFFLSIEFTLRTRPTPISMRPPEVADQQVIAAGHALQAEGRTVTGYALRQKLGGGSGSRLAGVWALHLANQQSAAEAAMPELPVEVAEQLAALTKDLTDRLGLLARGMNDKAVKAAERRVSELVRTVEEKSQQAEREVADADVAVNELEAALDKARSAHSQLETAHQEALGQLQSKGIEVARFQERQVADTQEIERLRTEVQQLSQARDHAEREAAIAKEAAAAAREDAAGLRGENRTLQQQNEQLLKKLDKSA